MRDTFDAVWARIQDHAGQEFRLRRGKPFVYSVAGNYVFPPTNRQLPKTDFERAFKEWPVPGPGAIQDLQGPSYIWAILADGRILGPAGKPIG